MWFVRAAPADESGSPPTVSSARSTPTGAARGRAGLPMGPGTALGENVPVVEVAMAELAWQLRLPWWALDGRQFVHPRTIGTTSGNLPRAVLPHAGSGPPVSAASAPMAREANRAGRRPPPPQPAGPGRRRPASSRNAEDPHDRATPDRGRSSARTVQTGRSRLGSAAAGRGRRPPARPRSQLLSRMVRTMPEAQAQRRSKSVIPWRHHRGYGTTSHAEP